MHSMTPNTTLFGNNLSTFSQYHIPGCTFDQINNHSSNFTPVIQMRELYQGLRNISVFKINSSHYPLPGQQNRICVIKYREIYIPVCSYVASSREHKIEAHTRHFKPAVTHAISLIKELEKPTAEQSKLISDDHLFITSLKKMVSESELEGELNACGGGAASAATEPVTLSNSNTPSPKQKRTPSPPSYTSIAQTLASLTDQTEELHKLSTLIERNGATIAYISQYQYRIGSNEIKLKVRSQQLAAARDILISDPKHHVFYAALCMSLPKDLLVAEIKLLPQLFIEYTQVQEFPLFIPDVFALLWGVSNNDQKTSLAVNALEKKQLDCLKLVADDLSTCVDLIANVLSTITRYDQYKILYSMSEITTEGALALHTLYLQKNRSLIPHADHQQYRDKKIFLLPADQKKSSLLRIDILGDQTVARMVNNGHITKDTKLTSNQSLLSACFNANFYQAIEVITQTLPQLCTPQALLKELLKLKSSKQRPSDEALNALDLIIAQDAHFSICELEGFHPELVINLNSIISTEQAAVFIRKFPAYALSIHMLSSNETGALTTIKSHPEQIRQITPDEFIELLGYAYYNEILLLTDYVLGPSFLRTIPRHKLSTASYQAWFTAVDIKLFENLINILSELYKRLPSAKSDEIAAAIEKVAIYANKVLEIEMPYSEENGLTLIAKNFYGPIVCKVLSRIEKNTKLQIPHVWEITNSRGENLLHIAVLTGDYGLALDLSNNPKLFATLCRQKNIDQKTPYCIAIELDLDHSHMTFLMAQNEYKLLFLARKSSKIPAKSITKAITDANLDAIHAHITFSSEDFSTEAIELALSLYKENPELTRHIILIALLEKAIGPKNEKIRNIVDTVQPELIDDMLAHGLNLDSRKRAIILRGISLGQSLNLIKQTQYVLIANPFEYLEAELVNLPATYFDDSIINFPALYTFARQYIYDIQHKKIGIDKATPADRVSAYLTKMTTRYLYLNKLILNNPRTCPFAHDTTIKELAEYFINNTRYLCKYIPSGYLLLLLEELSEDISLKVIESIVAIDSRIILKAIPLEQIMSFCLSAFAKNKTDLMVVILNCFVCNEREDIACRIMLRECTDKLGIISRAIQQQDDPQIIHWFISLEPLSDQEMIGPINDNQSMDGNTLLMQAVQYNCSELVEYLVKPSALNNLKVNKQSKRLSDLVEQANPTIQALFKKYQPHIFMLKPVRTQSLSLFGEDAMPQEVVKQQAHPDRKAAGKSL
ncbi:hypothetical protein MMH89_01970 [Candidatus Comchoanobacter bicostacola]|uniref:Ankyrin repeats (3 copies) n=1 Tax=Candidatus Comchoanobacter bicostacola TaxID=2919598 RepID=A0ABY5DKA5_9GAMM|nr:hypothetical protein [Candidatus Comchoanobacter bicostacola]UTC24915.1 hypothetical protein MMH89_01970 [Candidatus Comchoanobacter bicostacola]